MEETFTTKDSQNLRVRPICARDLEGLLKLMKQEGWSATIEDVESANAPGCPPMGGYVACQDDGTVISCAQMCMISDDVAFVAVYITHPDFRGKGIGSFVLKKALTSLDDKNIQLNTQHPEIYYRYGFKLGSSKVEKASITVLTENLQKIDDCSEYAKLKPLNNANVNDLAKYDSKIHPFSDRSKRLASYLLSNGMTSTLAYVDDKVVGFAAVRKLSDVKYRASSVYADDPNIAKCLLLWVAKLVPDGATLALYVCGQNPHVKQLLGNLGEVTYQEERTDFRLYGKEELPFSYDKIYTCTNLLSFLV